MQPAQQRLLALRAVAAKHHPHLLAVGERALLHAAAAKLSYDKYQSPFWAVIDFFFGSIYIPYYAFFLNTPSQQPLMGGRRRR